MGGRATAPRVLLSRTDGTLTRARGSRKDFSFAPGPAAKQNSGPSRPGGDDLGAPKAEYDSVILGL